MEKEEIKQRLHSIIDAIDDEQQLINVLTLMEPETAYQTSNWFDKLDEIQLARLNLSIAQADKGQFIDHETVKSKYAQWLK